jgi:hypothetical protein
MTVAYLASLFPSEPTLPNVFAEKTVSCSSSSQCRHQCPRSMAADTKIYLRAPNAARIPSPTAILPPPLKWLSGTWKLTHSTLLRWRKSRNVTVTYTLSPKSSTAVTPKNVRTLQWGTQIEDSISWQPLSRSSGTCRTAKGLNKPSGTGGEANGELKQEFYGDTFSHGERASLMYLRRANGWSRLIRSEWEILGYGVDSPSPYGQEHICYAKGKSWVLVYVTKSLLAPSGLNIFCRHDRLPNETVDAIRSVLAELGGEMTGLAQELVEIVLDVQENKIQSFDS